MAKNTTTNEKKVVEKKVVKKRNWTFIIYPESLPTNWKELLQDTGLPIAISPIHDKDLDPTGLLKKSHYHVMTCYNGPTSFDVVKRLTDTLNAPIPKPLESIKGMYRYFTHKDNPDKVQYLEKDIQLINGFSVLDFIELSKGEVVAIKKELQLLIIEKIFIEYSDFVDHVMFNCSDNFYDVASGHTYFFNQYITSKRHKLKNDNSVKENEKSVYIDTKTGEIFNLELIKKDVYLDINTGEIFNLKERQQEQ